MKIVGMGAAIWALVAVLADFGVDPPEPSPILIGTEAPQCAWPTAVGMFTGISCSATLVHPSIILYAAHCGTNHLSVRFGEDALAPARTVAIAQCERNPNWDLNAGPTDFAYCRLSEPVDDLEIAPILMGCELDLLEVGGLVTIVGFGETETGPVGTKHYLESTLNDVSPDLIEVEGMGIGACGGDSGGPAFVQLADGSWHVFGILTGVQLACGGDSLHVPMNNVVQWVEDATSLDMTPCHDADGTWNPTPQCEGFPLEMLGGGASWDDGCRTDQLSEKSATCGAAFAGDPDAEPPNVIVSDPPDATMFDRAPITLDISIEADDGDGWGVRRVWVEVDGIEIELGGELVTDETIPYLIPGLQFPMGVYEIVGFAEDWAGNVGQSDPSVIAVATELPGTDTGTTTDSSATATGTGTSSGTGDGSTSTDTGSESGAGGSEGGCGCRSSGSFPAWALACGVALGYRRRRAGLRSSRN